MLLPSPGDAAVAIVAMGVPHKRDAHALATRPREGGCSCCGVVRGSMSVGMPPFAHGGVSISPCRAPTNWPAEGQKAQGVSTSQC